jgi:hypothetical protein
MSHHPVEITLTRAPDRHVLRVADVFVNFGDTLQYFCKDGSVRVLFDTSPFSDVPGEVIHGEIRKIKKVAAERRFFGKCFVTPKGEAKEIGWSKNKNPDSGGDVVVKP